MKKLFLCGHTGSNNRGCEAIVRSTVKLMSEAGVADKPTLATFSEQEDKSAQLQEIVKLLPYSRYSSKLQRILYAIKRKVFNNPLAGQNIVQRKLWNSVERSDLCLSIGGDTYCYGTPTVFMAHNRKMQELSVPSVLWCCSLGKNSLTGKVIDDLKRYSLIVARETITRDTLVSAGVDKNKILLCCDPAFALDTKECSLPKGFVEGNTLGLNLSSIVNTPEVMEAVFYLIEKILSESDMTVCLIPHVYSVSPESGDLQLLRSLYDKYSHTGRVCIVEESLSCEELKFIIGSCRFFVGARTHSTIAAYSKGVPTLVLGYSVKSMGIAKDIFGNWKGFMLPYTDVKTKEDIYSALSKIISREQEIKELYSRVLPDYTASVRSVAQTIYNRYLGD